jgi:predicted amidohydrolase YtcJ
MIRQYVWCRKQTAQLVRQQGGRSHASGRVHWGHVKAFHDGSLGSRTALMHEPYSDEPDNAGMRVVPLEQLRDMAAEADVAELHVSSPGPQFA